MFEIIKNVFNNLLFFFLHLSSPGSFPKPLTQKQEAELLEKFKNENDASARSELIEHNLRLVAHIVKKYYSSGAEQDDLVSIGTLGLIKGIDNYRPEKGTKLATYASRCIENAIYT
ncbi:MAG: sigma-70 family RNA polymerase sigma factor [Acutalibacteraceae bacterium]